MFGHERFEAYQLSIKFLEQALHLIDRLPSGNSELREQFRKAAISIPLNIAEGPGRRQKPDKHRFYMIARGSAMECAAICDVVALLDYRLKSDVEDSKGLLESIVSILTRVCLK